jgi:hypothetical protein
MEDYYNKAKFRIQTSDSANNSRLFEGLNIETKTVRSYYSDTTDYGTILNKPLVDINKPLPILNKPLPELPNINNLTQHNNEQMFDITNIESSILMLLTTNKKSSRKQKFLILLLLIIICFIDLSPIFDYIVNYFHNNNNIYQSVLPLFITGIFKKRIKKYVLSSESSLLDNVDNSQISESNKTNTVLIPTEPDINNELKK